MGEKTDFSPKMAFCLQGFRLCGGDQRAMKTGEACGRPLDCFASPSKFIARYRNIFSWCAFRSLCSIINQQT